MNSNTSVCNSNTSVRLSNRKYTAYDSKGKVIIISQNPRVVSSILYHKFGAMWDWTHNRKDHMISGQ